MGQDKQAEAETFAITAAAAVWFSPATITCATAAAVVLYFEGGNRRGRGGARAESVRI